VSNASTTDKIPEEVTMLRIRIPEQIISRLKVQAIAEKISTEDLSARIFAEYLDSDAARGLRKEVA